MAVNQLWPEKFNTSAFRWAATRPSTTRSEPQPSRGDCLPKLLVPVYLLSARLPIRIISHLIVSLLDTPQGLEQVARRGEVFAAVQALDAALGVRASLGQAAPGRRMRPAVAAHWRPAGSTLTVHGAPALGSSPRVPPTCFFLKHPGKQPDISRFPSCSLSIESFTTHFCGSISSS